MCIKLNIIILKITDGCKGSSTTYIICILCIKLLLVSIKYELKCSRIFTSVHDVDIKVSI